MIQEILDEVLDTSLQSDTNPRYTIKDNSGNIINDNVQIDLKTPVVTGGTPLNRATLANLQGDLYTQDRYNVPTITFGKVGGYIQGNLFPTNWAEITTGTQYSSDNGTKIIASSYTPNYEAHKAFDGASNTRWRANIDLEGTQTHYMIVELPEAKKIRKIYIAMFNATTPRISSIIIKGSKDGSNYVALYDIGANLGVEDIPASEITLNNIDYYKFYKIEIHGDASFGIGINEFECREYWEETGENKYINKLELPLTSYETGKIVNIEGNSYILAEGDYTEEHFTSDIIPTFEAGMTTVTNQYGTWEITDESHAKLYDKNDTTGCASSYNAENTYIKSVMSSDYKRFAIKPTKIRVVGKNSYANVLKGVKLDGTVEKIFTIPANSNYYDKTFDIETSNYYTEFHFSLPASSSTSYLYSFEIIEGDIIYGVIQTEAITSFDKPYININNLGEKLINGTIKAGNKYRLVYNGESWDINESKVVTGTFTSVSTIQTIELGFQPDLVICYAVQNNLDTVASSTSSVIGNDVPRILTSAYLDDTYGRIVPNGFSFKASKGTPVYYIAIKL